jgi:ABC-2 type transport system permease protein
MKNIISITKREIFSFFVSPVAYFVITGFILLAGYFFLMYFNYFNIALMQAAGNPFGGGMENMNLNRYVIEPFYQTLIVILVFMTPLLTMRVLADEKKKGTFELLLTSPLSVFEIVLGKFFGIAFVIVIMMCSVFFFPYILVVYGNPSPEVAPIFTGLAGILLCSLSFVSIGIAVSSFTENQVVAGMCSMVTLLIFYMIQSPAQAVGGVAEKVLTYMSPLTHLEELVKGVISTKSIVYFLSVILLGIFLSQRALETQRSH